MSESDQPDAAPSLEFERIERLFAPLAGHDAGTFALRNDGAVFRPRTGLDYVVTTDMIVAGVHFPDDDPPESIAAKALRVNLSDIAAMGAVAEMYSLSFALPRETGEAWLEGFAAGLRGDQQTYGLHLTGGDSTSTHGPITIAVTLWGRLEGPALVRSGAAVGDRVYVTGTLGDSALGLLARLDQLDARERAAAGERGLAYLIDRYRHPRPRLELGRRLTGLASACLDVSDGLVADLGHIARHSRVAVELDLPSVPLARPVQAVTDANPERLRTVFTGGDDYELAFTAPPEHHEAILRAAKECAVEVTVIGRCIQGRNVICRDGQGRPIDPGQAGWSHF